MRCLPCLAIAALSLVPLRAARPPTIELWPEGVPGLKPNARPEREEAGRFTDIHYPSLVVYAPAPAVANRTAIIYAPGGGYVRVAAGENGGEITRWLTSRGCTVFLLKYRHVDYGHPAPLRDALRAVRLVRSRAADFRVDAERIGMIGGSAGAHLTATAGTLFDAPEGRTGAALDQVSGRPDFMILVFPIIVLEHPYTPSLVRQALLGTNAPAALVQRLSPHRHVTRDTPPTFIVHTAEDTTAPVENSLRFYEAMRGAKAPVEMHLYPTGPHGSGMSEAFGPVAEWPRLCEAWMRQNGWLPPGRK